MNNLHVSHLLFSPHTLVIFNFMLNSKPFFGGGGGGSTVSKTMLNTNSALLFLKLIQGVPGGKDLTSGECSLGQTIPI
jgi:hypothetical protein